MLQDSGSAPDEQAGDGIYTGTFQFDDLPDDDVYPPQGVWNYTVIAQDVNTAPADLVPEEAAQIIGGVILTKQFTIEADGGCAEVTDGQVNVI